MNAHTEIHTPGEIEPTTIGSNPAWRVYDENGRPWLTTTSYESACELSASILGEDADDDEDGYSLERHEADERAMLEVL